MFYLEFCYDTSQSQQLTLVHNEETVCARRIYEYNNKYITLVRCELVLTSTGAGLDDDSRYYEVRGCIVIQSNIKISWVVRVVWSTMSNVIF